MKLIHLDNNYDFVEEFYNIPVPKNAKLESENEVAKSYKWESSKGTSVPLSYRLMIKKTGWNEREKDGANIVYEKDGHDYWLQ